jgi:ATP-dependent DNA ligase
MVVTVRSNGFIEPCIPTRAAKPPAGPDWVHEIKHDGYRLMVRGASPLVRLFTRRRNSWGRGKAGGPVFHHRWRGRSLRL